MTEPRHGPGGRPGRPLSHGPQLLFPLLLLLAACSPQSAGSAGAGPREARGSTAPEAAALELRAAVRPSSELDSPPPGETGEPATRRPPAGPSIADRLRQEFGDPLRGELARALIAALIRAERFEEAAAEQLRRFGRRGPYGTWKHAAVQPEAILDGLERTLGEPAAVEHLRALLATQFKSSGAGGALSSTVREVLLARVARHGGALGQGLRDWVWKGANGASDDPWRWSDGSARVLSPEELALTVADPVELLGRLEPLVDGSDWGFDAAMRILRHVRDPRDQLAFLTRVVDRAGREELRHRQFRNLLSIGDREAARALVLDRLAADANPAPYVRAALHRDDLQLVGELLDAVAFAVEDWSAERLNGVYNELLETGLAELDRRALDLALSRSPAELAAHEGWDAASIWMLAADLGPAGIDETQRAGLLAHLDALEARELALEREENDVPPGAPGYEPDAYERAELAHALLRLGALERAIELFRPAFEADPEEHAWTWAELTAGRIPGAWRND